MKKIIEAIETFLDYGGLKKQIILLVISGAALLCGLFDLLPFDASWVAIVLCGLPIILEALIGLIEEFNIKSGVLVSIALVASCAIGETFAAGEVAFIMQLGELLEHMTVKRARSGIEKLVKLTPRTARLIVDGEESIIPSEEIRVGDVIRVLPGESVSVDGVIVKGETSIDESLMTGESLPVDKRAGDEVFSGTVNQTGAFEMRAQRVGEDSFVQRMAALVKSADAKKSKIVGIADRWATWIVVAALLAALGAWVITGEAVRAVTVLVVFCPCALVLATPTAIMAAIGNASHNAILVSKGDAFERLVKIDRICFDKTGTLTYGTPEVVRVESLSNYNSEEILRLCAMAEQYSEHPLGRAVVKRFKKDGGKLGEAHDFEAYLGRGVGAVCEDKELLAGNEVFLRERGIEMPDTKELISDGTAVIFVSIDSLLAGYMVLSDREREDSGKTLEELRKMGISSTLLTGDKKEVAQKLSKGLALLETRAECLPEDKLLYIEDCQKRGESVLMIGDGINDAPALKCADVGVAMGGVGSDIALEASDIVLVHDELSRLPYLLKLSRKTFNTVKWNIIFSMGLNFVAVVLAATGILNPIVGALVHNAGSVAVVLNSSLLLKWREKK